MVWEGNLKKHLNKINKIIKIINSDANEAYLASHNIDTCLAHNHFIVYENKVLFIKETNQVTKDLINKLLNTNKLNEDQEKLNKFITELREQQELARIRRLKQEKWATRNQKSTLQL